MNASQTSKVRWPRAVACFKHETFSALYILKNTGDGKTSAIDSGYACRIPASTWRHYNGHVVPLSAQYICPLCGENWCELRVLSEDTIYETKLSVCSTHGYGILFDGEREEYLDWAPIELLENELLIFLENEKLIP